MSKYESVVVIPAHNEEVLIRRPLVALNVAAQTDEVVPVVVVNNNSADGTLDMVERCRSLTNLDIHLLEEIQQGTGAAVDTGFRYAIEELGANVIARTDADTLPLPPWFSALSQHHQMNREVYLLTGPVWRGFDVPDRVRDIYLENTAVRLAKRSTRLIRAIKTLNPNLFFKFAPGHNLSTTREAYLETGGFPRTSVGEADEDYVYNTLVSDSYGRNASGYERNMAVFTSSRRLRTAGYLRSALHYSSVNRMAK